MVLQIDEITRLFDTKGTARYGGEPISQQQHALQCAHLAEQAGGSPEIIAAALLHDLGHLLASYSEKLPEGVDDGHQYVAIPFLRGLFPDAVIEPIRLHVDAKRYLCAVDSSYWASLSASSRRSLMLQGGPFSAAEAGTFIERSFATDSVALRRWDDLARDPSARTPVWSHYLCVLHRATLRALAAAD